MADYPLIFTLTHEIRCPKFSARIVSRGRALMVLEDGEWWCHGVEPGGLTEHGEQPAHAFAGFKGALGEIFQDLAGDAASLEAFARAVREFISEGDSTEAVRWEAARLQVRSSGKDVAAPFDQLPREVREIRASVRVEKLEHIEAAEELVALAEAA